MPRNNHPGLFRPGVSGNPNGRPKGSIGLAAYVQQQTNKGRVLMDFLLHVINDDTAKNDDRIRAVGLLLDRGWGKPEQPISAPAGLPVLLIGSERGSNNGNGN